jgi:molecular chaperone HtpG
MASERFQVDLRGIIDLAANHLYSSPDVFVRELIQNAVDAITARQEIDPASRGRVTIELTTGDGQTPPTISVSDNGIGLTEAEVHMFLSTVGGSSKRDMSQIHASDEIDTRRGTFLGRFGIGLLSCFMVTDEIVIVTKSARDSAAPGVEWRGRADGHYSVRELADRLDSGTTVHLRPKAYMEEYFELERLIELTRRYGEMLSTPIAVVGNGEVTGINHAPPIWAVAVTETELLDAYCESRLAFRALDSFRVRVPEAGLEGHVFIRPERSIDAQTSCRLYARGMFVSDEPSGLLPEWATFVSCVINTDRLRLTASRESLHHGPELERCEEAIGHAIRARLAHLLRADPVRFEAVMAAHDVEIRGLAVKDREFFELIIDLLSFDTTLGTIRFGEYRREHDRVLVARTSEQFRRLAPVAQASGVRVFNGGYTFHEELLTLAVQRHPNLALQAFDAADIAELWPRSEDTALEALAMQATEVLAEREIQGAVRAFEPASIPAYFALGLEGEYHRQLDRVKSRASGVWHEILDAMMAPRPEAPTPTRLCLNANSPLVRRVALVRDSFVRRTAIEVLYVQALLLGQHHLGEPDLLLLTSGLGSLLDSAVAGCEEA